MSFIPPSNVLNNVSPKRIKRTFNPNTNKQSVLDYSKKIIKDSYDISKFNIVGTVKGVVLEIVSEFVESAEYSWKHSKTAYMESQNKLTPFAQIRVRVPEIHAHLPEPSSPEDYNSISEHPIVLLFQTTTSTLPEIGDIVEIDFADKENFKDGEIVGVTTSNVQNSTPTDLVQCSPSEVFNSAVPPLNMAEPQGDEISSFQPEIKNDYNEMSNNFGVYSSEESYVNGLQSNYFVSMKEFNLMEDFNNPDSISKVLKSKMILNMSFQIYDNGQALEDINRLSIISKEIKKTNIGVYLWASTNASNSIDAISNLKKYAKTFKCDGIFVLVSGFWELEQISKFNSGLESFKKSEKLKVGYLVYDYDSNYLYSDDIDLRYVLRNNIDNYDQREFKFSILDYDLYHLDGYNFLVTQSDPCRDGKRKAKDLKREMNKTSVKDSTNIHRASGFINYDSLDQDKISVIKDNLGLSEEDLQNFLNTTESPKSIQKQNLSTTSEQAIVSKEEAEFNRAFDEYAEALKQSTQDSLTKESSKNLNLPGMQCSTSPIGASPFQELQSSQEVFQSSAIESNAPLFKYSELDANVTPEQASMARQLWTTNQDRVLSVQHVVFLNQLATKVYQKIPITDPIFSSTDAKKLRITDAIRTPEKQVYLMWDKRKSKSAASVKNLYSNASWASKVVDLYPYDSSDSLTTSSNFEAALNTQNYFDAVDVVKGRIKQGSSKGGHLYGNGVDIGTIYNLAAEGVRNVNQKVTEEQMKATRFVKAVTDSVKELQGSFVVEDYQEHIHITFRVT